MSIDVHQYVLRLDIPVYHILAVEVVEADKDLAKIKPGCVLGEETQLVEVEEDLTTCAEVHHKEQFFRLYY